MEKLETLYSELVNKLIAGQLTITCMESMTGGFVASCITDISGASGIFKGSYVAYSNEEKIRLGVPGEIIEKYTVYSEETVRAMARAAADSFHSDMAVGITGNAGTVDPVNRMGIPGEVYMAFCMGEKEKVIKLVLDSALTRREMKKRVAERAAEELLRLLEEL